MYMFCGYPPEKINISSTYTAVPFLVERSLGLVKNYDNKQTKNEYVNVTYRRSYKTVYMHATFTYARIFMFHLYHFY